MMDFALTCIFLLKTNITYEGNPLLRSLILNFGFEGFALAKLLASFTCVALCLWGTKKHPEEIQIFNRSFQLLNLALLIIVCLNVLRLFIEII